MNKQQFLFELRRRLSRLPQAEAENAVRFYDELITDAGEDPEYIKTLGAPAAIAAKIIGEYAFNDAKQIPIPPPKKNNALEIILIAVLALFAAPIALPIAIALAAVVFSLVVAFGAVAVGLVASAAAVTLAGLGMAIASVTVIGGGAASFMFMLGYGLVALAGGLLLCIVTIKLIKWFFRLIQKLLGKILMKTKKKESVGL